MRLMNALVKEHPGPGIALRRIPVPTLQAGEVLIRVRACGIGGSEIGRYMWDENYSSGGAKDMTASLPRVLGTEIAGEIASIGDAAGSWNLGDRVVVNNIVGCGRCEHCVTGTFALCRARQTIGVDRDGGFAEYCAVPAENVMSMPDDLSFALGALVQPFSIAAHALEIAQTHAGDRVGIWGAGIIGLSILENARLAGAEISFVVGRSRQRLALAAALGARNTFSVLDGDVRPRLAGAFGRESIDAIFEAAGTPDVFSALPQVSAGGSFVLVGNFRQPVLLDLVSMRRREVNLLCVRSFTAHAWRRAAGTIGSSGLHEGVLGVYSLAEGESAFRASTEGRLVKAIISPSNDGECNTPL